jgi:hypothetical protein
MKISGAKILKQVLLILQSSHFNRKDERGCVRRKKRSDSMDNEAQ